MEKELLNLERQFKELINLSNNDESQILFIRNNIEKYRENLNKIWLEISFIFYFFIFLKIKDGLKEKSKIKYENMKKNVINETYKISSNSEIEQNYEIVYFL